MQLPITRILSGQGEVFEPFHYLAAEIVLDGVNRAVGVNRDPTGRIRFCQFSIAVYYPAVKF